VSREVDVQKAAADDERKKAERQAKLAIWKKKQEEKKAAEMAAVASSPRPSSVGNDIGAASPATAASPTASAAVSTAPGSPEAEDGPAKPYAGKFDPKAIAKRAAAASQKLKNATLEDNAALPGKSKSTASSLTNGHISTDNSIKPSQNAPVGESYNNCLYL